MNFEYNKHIIEYIKIHGQEQFHRVHLYSIKWLYDNLQNGRDFMFVGERAGQRTNKSILIVQELIWFDKEEDLLAFRLTTGL